MNLKSIIFVALLVGIGMCGTGVQDKKSIDKKSGDALLIVCFGTTHGRAQKTFEDFDADLEKRYSGKEIRWAYTSSIIRKRLKEKGKELEGVYESLMDLRDDGYTKITMQSLHTIPGNEYDDMVRDYRRFRHSIPEEEEISITMGKPLLVSYNDLEKTAQGLLRNAPKNRNPDEGLVFMGHGSEHHAGLVYTALASVLQEKDSNAVLGCAEGHPGINKVISECREKELDTLWLIPFMSIAGDHAVNDLAGDGKSSWKSILTANGFICKIDLNGTLRNRYIKDIWLEHLDEGLEQHDDI